MTRVRGRHLKSRAQLADALNAAWDATSKGYRNSSSASSSAAETSGANAFQVIGDDPDPARPSTDVKLYIREGRRRLTDKHFRTWARP